MYAYPIKHFSGKNSFCRGKIQKQKNGGIHVTGQFKKYEYSSGRLYFWASSPPDHLLSFSGSGLPFASAEMAFDKTPNTGFASVHGGHFSFRLIHPNTYYTNNGKDKIAPRVYFRHCSESAQIYLLNLSDLEVPFRDLNHNQNRTTPNFYTNKIQSCELTQEEIIRKRSYLFK